MDDQQIEQTHISGDQVIETQQETTGTASHGSGDQVTQTQQQMTGTESPQVADSGKPFVRQNRSGAQRRKARRAAARLAGLLPPLEKTSPARQDLASRCSSIGNQGTGNTGGRQPLTNISPSLKHGLPAARPSTGTQGTRNPRLPQISNNTPSAPGQQPISLWNSSQNIKDAGRSINSSSRPPLSKHHLISPWISAGIESTGHCSTTDLILAGQNRIQVSPWISAGYQDDSGLPQNSTSNPSPSGEDLTVPWTSTQDQGVHPRTWTSPGTQYVGDAGLPPPSTVSTSPTGYSEGTQAKQGTKRPCSEAPCPSLEPKGKKAKRERARAMRAMHAIAAPQIAPELKGAIVGQEYPKVPLTQEQATVIKDSLETLIDELPQGAPMPRFNVFQWSEQGAVLVTCADHESMNWLKSTLSQLEIGTPLLWMERDQLYKLKKVGCVAQTTIDGVPQLLKRLSRQNPGLNTDFWKIHQQTSLHDGKVRMIMSVDASSYRTLAANGWVAFAGVTTVRFWEFRKSRQSSERTGAQEGVSGESCEPAVAEVFGEAGVG